MADDLIGDAPCADCGRDPHIWSTPNRIWNAVMDPTDERGAIICPLCFMARAEVDHRMIWRLSGIDVDDSDRFPGVTDQAAWNFVVWCSQQDYRGPMPEHVLQARSLLAQAHRPPAESDQ